jgi:hypothetical protein
MVTPGITLSFSVGGDDAADFLICGISPLLARSTWKLRGYAA